MLCHILGCLALAAAAMAASVPTTAFGPRVNKAQGTASHLNHITGMTASKTLNNIVWMVTSSSSNPALYAVDVTTGNEVAWFNVTGAPGYDWEDLAYGPCVDDCGNGACGVGKPVSRYCLYIADIGNHGNDGAHDIVYMIREPDNIGDRSGVFMANVSVADKLTFSWSEPDAESLFITPDGHLYVISKVDTGRAMLAAIPDSAWGDNHVVLNENNSGVLKLFTTHHDPQGASLSPDGTELLLVGEEGCWYYSIPNRDYINTINTQVPQSVSTYIPVDDTEAVTWDAEGKGFYVFARGSNQYIYYYPRANPSVVG